MKDGGEEAIGTKALRQGILYVQGKGEKSEKLELGGLCGEWIGTEWQQGPSLLESHKSILRKRVIPCRWRNLLRVQHCQVSCV